MAPAAPTRLEHGSTAGGHRQAKRAWSQGWFEHQVPRCRVGWRATNEVEVAGSKVVWQEGSAEATMGGGFPGDTSWQVLAPAKRCQRGRGCPQRGEKDAPSRQRKRLK